MKSAKLTLDKAFAVSEVDRNLFGAFIEHMGRGVYEGIYQPGNANSDENGFRKDVLDLVRELGVTIVRYPGGNMVSAYNWEDGVGPKEDRPVRLEAAWKNIEDNSFGTNEFIDWSRKTGITPMLAVNLGTRGLSEAKDFLEYCNFPGGTSYSDLRKSHGYPDPHNVRYWCMGNEMDGPWQIGHVDASAYGSLAQRFAKIYKDIDPDVKIIACGSAGTRLPTFGQWDETVAEICCNYIDYISVHTYFDNRCKTDNDTMEFLASSLDFEKQIESVISAVDFACVKNRSDKKINLSVDEWNVVYRPHGKNPPDVNWTKAPHQIEDVYNLEDALVVGSILQTMINHADRVKIACLAQLVNVIAPIMTSDSSAWKQTIFYPFADCSKYAVGKSLRTSVECESYFSAKRKKDVPYISVSAVYDEGSDKLALFVLNRDLYEGCSLKLNLNGFDPKAISEHRVLNNDDIKAVNTENNPDNVFERFATCDTILPDGSVVIDLEPHSWNTVIIDVR
ncbi:MAG: alpha-N-arabinofuranosidase [Clostridia bacterium]|nr:alpha-N-arabinofuranosidase [Clostridia bacterium]